MRKALLTVSWKTLLVVGFLLYSSLCYAVDCSNSFDNTCLSGQYKFSRIKENRANREQTLDTRIKAVEEKNQLALEARIKGSQRLDDFFEQYEQEKIAREENMRKAQEEFLRYQQDREEHWLFYSIYNSRKNIVLGIYAVIIFSMCLFVPYKFRSGEFGGYSFLWSPPDSCRIQIDIARLILSMMAVTVLSAIAFEIIKNI